MNDQKCKLKTLRVLKSPDAQKASDHLTEVLGINPILQTDLNLSEKIDGDSGVEQLSVLLKDPHCRPETLQLSECNVTEKGCSALLTALRSEHSTLKELNLSKNRIQDSGVKLLSEELKNKLCKLETLSTNFIPDQSRPGLTTTAIGAVNLQGAGGNWATVGRRSRGGRRVRRQREKRKGKSVELRIGTLNVGTMTGKVRELADVMERRKVDILCVQETRWKGSKARSIGAGFKLFYYGVDSKRNGVGVVLKEEFVRNVLEVKRVSDRVMSLKLEIEGVMLNVVSGYAPQVGCELEEKERFWSELDEVMESIPMGERVVIGVDFNGHVGEGNTGDEEVMGKFGVKERNLEGQMVVDFAKRTDMAVVNTYFQKREEHRVTYKSGGRSTQVDYILCRRGNLKEISDCKVVVGESVARQHRMVVCRMTLMVCKKKRSEIEIEKKTKWWKLKKEECCEEFRQKLRQALGGQVLLPDDWETTAEVIRETGRKVLGVSSGRRKEDKETWWWNEEVQDSIQRKRLAKKKWDMDRTEENRQEYKELQRRVKREVSKAKQKAYDELYTRLDTREGEKDLYSLARQRDRDGKDVQQVRVIKDRDGRVLTSEESVQRRWKEYFEELMNEENEREKRVEGVNSVEQKVDKIRKDEVRKALKRMKSGKAVGPDDILVEVWKCLGEAAVEFLASLFNRVLESEKMPEEWRRSVLVPIFKNKGDVQSCSNYRGIKLMSHTMKKEHNRCNFALRILMEKYRDGQRELHCVFVDLEKAYDRVPREELWYCMRKSGVAEKYVRVVQDMYERSRTVVRCAVGQTEEFNVEVGLHQGSALSPFLFAIVMDQLSEEVRQESPWTMMFADDIVICSESREQVEENLERWRFALERRGMKVSGSKTEYMCVNEREGSGTVRLQGEEVKKVQEFKYLGSTVQSNGECGKEVKKRVQAGWNGWRKVSGVLCERKISARIKGKVYRTVVRPAMLYGLETVSLRKRQESELEVAELKMLRLMDNNIREEGYSALSEALKSSHLIELDLRGNDPGASGVKLLTDLLQDPDCKLNTLRLLKSPDAEEAYTCLTKMFSKNPLLHTELDLSNKTPEDVKVKQLSALLQDPHYRLQKLTLCKCSLTEDDCTAVVSALGLNPSHLKELDLSDNTLGDTGVKQLSDLLQNSHCTLEKLKLNNCRLTQTQCGDLAKTLESNSSSTLKELDLRGNYSVSRWNIFRYFLLNPNSKLIVRILSPEAEKACDDLTKALGTNPLLQTELDLSGKISGDSGVKQLSVLLKEPQCRTETLRLNKSSITHRGCTDLISALTSNPSHLTELDLSENTLGNSAMDEISTLLQNSSCKLQKLVLSDCNITEEGYTALIKALKSNCSSLIELDLRGNDPGPSGLKELRNLMNDKKCKLKTLRVLKSPDAQKASDHLTEVLGINPILQTDLNLSGKIDGDSGVEQLSVLLKDPHCRPETLQLSECNVTEKGCSALLTALRSEHSTLKELNLSKNRIQDSGVKLLSEELKNKLCKLDTLRLMDNNIREEGYSALAEALKSSHLIELDLRGNDPGASGVKLLTDLLQDPDCKLNTLRLWKSPDAEEAYTCLTKMFSKNPLLHTELDLSNKTPEDVKVKQLSALLQDPHYRLQKLTLYKEDSMTDDDCSHVISALVLNPSHLRELNLNRNKPGESGLRDLCDFLKNPKCTLQTLKLWSSVSEKSCTDLVSALCTNPSHIRELDLSECELGDSGVEKLCDLLKKHECKLETLLLWDSVSEKSCTDLVSALCTNPSHIRELDLSECELGDSGVEKLCDLLKKHECKLEKLLLWKSVKGKSCTDLVSALCTNPSHIRELDLSECELGDSGVEKLCDLLKKHECKLEKLLLKKCSITDGGAAALTAALRSNPSHLKQLDLRENKLKYSTVEQLSEILKGSGGQLMYDGKTWSQKARNLLSFGKSNKQPISGTDSSTVKMEQKDGEKKDTHRGGSSVDLDSCRTDTDIRRTETSGSLYNIREQYSSTHVTNTSNAPKQQEKDKKTQNLQTTGTR
ncbi:hypothetical protein QTP86_015886 [Hemibagrus guttatus]|nr:hypothetical protein QTP86_015886 [Hemibagrus guttatus]